MNSGHEYLQGLKVSTAREVEAMIASGMVELDTFTLEWKLNNMGYKIDYRDTINYINTSNERHYKAKSVRIVDIASGLGFGSIDCKNPNLEKLQALRKSSFVFNLGYIWEL
jgi:hypothetical protein